MSFTRVDSGEAHEGIARDLSATGILIECACELPTGTLLEVHINPAQSILPPLDARVEVIRCDSPGPGVFVLGTEIKAFLNA
jgi:hypothetical protein